MINLDPVLGIRFRSRSILLFASAVRLVGRILLVVVVYQTLVLLRISKRLVLSLVRCGILVLVLSRRLVLLAPGLVGCISPLRIALRPSLGLESGRCFRLLGFRMVFRAVLDPVRLGSYRISLNRIVGFSFNLERQQGLVLLLCCLLLVVVVCILIARRLLLL